MAGHSACMGRSRHGFALEACEATRITSDRARQHLDRDLAFQVRVGRAIDLTHPAHAICDLMS
jgi:hypothetical protein